MTTFVLTDVNKTVNIEFMTDLINGQSNSGFTVMDIRGLSDAEVALGVNIDINVYNKKDLKDIATKLDLKLTSHSTSGVETLVDFSGVYYNGGLGIDNL